MTPFKSFASTAIVLLAVFSSILGDHCYAQNQTRSTVARENSGGPGGPILRRASSRHPVRTASATREILAPTAMGVTDERSESVNSYIEPLDATSVGSEHTACDSCGGTACCCWPNTFLFDWTRADLWAGVAGFTVPANFLNTANNSPGAIEGAFGFQEGANFGTQVPSLLCGQMGSQVGLRFIHSQLEGSAAAVDHRQQLFLTAGLFRRVDYGVQGGLVVDYLHDDWIYKADLLQLRGELSYLLSPCHELGFRFTDSQQIDDNTYRLSGSVASTNIRIASLDTYRFFYRMRFSEQARGQAEMQAGWTKDSGAILGLNLNTPLQNQLGLSTTATYLIPPSDASPSYASEGWNIGLALVWTPGRKFGLARDYYRPLFDVADNGSMISKFN